MRARIPEYAGLDDPAARQVSDQRLRAWAGECLASLREGIAPGEGARDRIDDAILRCELGDQRLIAAFAPNGTIDEPSGRARLAAADEALIAAVDVVVAATDPAASARAIEAVHAALDARLAAALPPETVT